MPKPRKQKHKTNLSYAPSTLPTCWGGLGRVGGEEGRSRVPTLRGTSYIHVGRILTCSHPTYTTKLKGGLQPPFNLVAEREGFEPSVRY